MLHQRLCDENRRKKVWIRRYHRLGFCDAFFGWMVTKRLYLQIGAQKKTRFFSLMYFCESLCINRISHNYVIPQFLFCIIMSFRTSFHIPFRKLIPSFTLTASELISLCWITMFKLFFMRIATPLAFVLPCENKTEASHSFRHWSCRSVVEWVSCKNIKSAFCFLHQEKIALRLWKLLRPLTFKERNLMLSGLAFELCILNARIIKCYHIYNRCYLLGKWIKYQNKCKSSKRII